MMLRLVGCRRWVWKREFVVIRSFSSSGDIRDPSKHARWLAERKARLPSASSELTTLQNSTTSLPTAAIPPVTIESLFRHNVLSVSRQVEWLDIFLHFKPQNQYVIHGHSHTSTQETLPPLAYLIEENSFSKTLVRQFAGRSRPFSVVLLDTQGRVLLRLERGFTLINSHVQVFDGIGQLLGEVRQIFHLWRRRYALFLNEGQVMKQFASIDGPLLTWDFELLDAEQKPTGALITRQFKGLVREMFTDSGVYAVQFVPPSNEQEQQNEALAYSRRTLLGTRVDIEKSNTLPSATSNALITTQSNETLAFDPEALIQRIVCLACAVTIDFDYFSRHSGSAGSAGLPIPWFPFFTGSSGSIPSPESASNEGGVPLGETPSNQGEVDGNNNNESDVDKNENSGRWPFGESNENDENNENSGTWWPFGESEDE